MNKQGTNTQRVTQKRNGTEQGTEHRMIGNKQNARQAPLQSHENGRRRDVVPRIFFFTRVKSCGSRRLRFSFPSELTITELHQIKDPFFL